MSVLSVAHHNKWVYHKKKKLKTATVSMMSAHVEACQTWFPGQDTTPADAPLSRHSIIMQKHYNQL